MERISSEKIVNTVLSPRRLNKLAGFACAYSDSHVQVISEDCPSASTHYEEGRSGFPYYVITLGKVYSVKDNVNDLVSERFEKFSDYYLGLFYHEFFHVLYTDFVNVYNKLNSYAIDANVHNFVMTVLNICEDYYINNIGKYYFPDSEKYINKIETEELINKIKENYLEELPSSNPKKLDELEAIVWLLIYCPEEFMKTDTYLKNKKFYDSSRQQLLITFDSETRSNKQILFAIELLKMLEDKNYEPNEQNLNKSPKDITKELENRKDPGYCSKCGDETMRKMMDAIKHLSNSGRKELEAEINKRNEGMSQGQGNQKQEAGDEGSNKDSDKGNGQDEDKNEIDKQDKEIIKVLEKNKQRVNLTSVPVNTSPSTEDGLFLARMSDYRSENVIKIDMKKSDDLKYLDYIRENCNYINQIQNIINRIRLMSQGNVAHNQKSGKFDRKSACKQYPTLTPFKKNIAPKILPDLVFHLIVDGSGSMYGRKAKEAINALLLFTTALERLGIPFAIEYFNDGYDNIERIMVKEYNDKSEYKKRLAYIYENDGWSANGNIDEINILHASQDLKARKEKDKFMVVFSDGATCGDEDDLHNLIVELSKQGINPIGIGLGDDTVCGIYPTSIYLKNNEFDELIKFLKECLLKPFYKSLIQ